MALRDDAVWESAEEIARRWLNGERQADLAAAFAVSQNLISRVTRTATLGEMAPSKGGARLVIHRSDGKQRAPVEPPQPFVPPSNPEPRETPFERKPGEAEKFWAQVQKTDGCWLWTGNRTPDGYGRFSQGKYDYEYAHRVAWRLTFGPIPNGKKICHRCDVYPCTRPDHLFAGTQLDNMRDKIAKMRGACGEANRSGKLSWAQVQRMRELREHEGWKLRQLAELFKVTAAQVSNIVNYRQRRTC